MVDQGFLKNAFEKKILAKTILNLTRNEFTNQEDC